MIKKHRMYSRPPVCSLNVCTFCGVFSFVYFCFLPPPAVEHQVVAPPPYNFRIFYLFNKNLEYKMNQTNLIIVLKNVLNSKSVIENILGY